MNRSKLILISGFLLIFILPLHSQVPFTASEIRSDFNRGMELFNKEKYAAAIRFFDSYINKEWRSGSIEVSDARPKVSIVIGNILYRADIDNRIIFTGCIWISAWLV